MFFKQKKNRLFIFFAKRRNMNDRLEKNGTFNSSEAL